jgi:hypothetical protein
MQDKTNKSYRMKKISTMFLGLVLTAAVFAADKRPDVTIISAKKYEIVIDGKTYFSNNRMMSIDNLRNGRHTIQVFEMKLGGFSIFKRKQLVTSKAFQLRNNDVRITIDRFGHLTITEDRFGRDNRYDDRDNKYDSRDNKYDKDQKDWDDHDHNGKDNRGSRF